MICSMAQTIRASAMTAGSQPRTLSFEVSKKRVGRRLEFLLRKVTRRRAVILAEVVDDAVAVEPECVR